ncbi:MAG: efflux RND transporter periplasmic adaptor subunit [Dysgonamonadaceae bacterium]|jgi:RND family efflux transporter MFP subunit|nr:efflux RND transporter periplasmic adaptor subunit [Dysgonamonadaceae bacterium]
MKLYTFILIINCLLLFACTGKRTNVEKTARTVKVDTVRAYKEAETSVFIGKIKAAADINLSFRVAGPIEKIQVTEGAHIRKGDVLAILDSRDYEVQLAATEAEYLRIKAESDRIVELHKSGGVTDNDCDKAVYGLKQITAKYEAHKNALADTRLIAPIDGYVQKRILEEGETAGAGMTVLSIITADNPEVEINIPASELIKRDRFNAFSCTVDVFPENVFLLDLVGITHKANMNQLYTVRLKMRAGEQQTMPSPGMVTTVNIHYKPEDSTMVTIPLSAMFENNSVSSVWVYDPNSETVRTRNVFPAELRKNGNIVVFKGLSAGEIVVSAGVHSLKEGEKVRVLEKPSESNVGGML